MTDREAIDGLPGPLDVSGERYPQAYRLWGRRPCYSWHNRHNTGRKCAQQMPANLPVSEPHLRAAVRVGLLARAHAEGGRVYEEFTVERGAARIDLAMVARQLEGFELKSDHDSFARLAEQMHTYNRVFDSLTLVTGAAFADPARSLMPPWWGLVVARHTSAGLELVTVRQPSSNPGQDAHSLAMLLWREEALAVLTQRNDRPPRGASRAVLHERLATLVPIAQLRLSVIERLQERFAQSAVAANTR